MGTFDDIKLSWEGRTYVVPSNRVMGAIIRIEEVITLPELQSYLSRKAVPMARVASAFAAVLRYAGCLVEDEEVYAGMFKDGGASAMESVTALVLMMLPRDSDVAVEVNRGNVSAADSLSSRKRTRRQSAAAG